MIASQMKSIIKVIGKTAQDGIVGNGTAYEPYVGSDGHVGGLGRKQIVHHNDLRGIMLQKLDNQIGANEARSPHNKNFGVLKSIFVHRS
jgi:hypothetical protein